MDALLSELAWFLPWCWFVNMSFSVFGFGARRYSWLARTDRSVDGGATFLGNRVLGDSTTWGGLAVALILGVAGEFFVPGHHFLMLAVLVFFGHALGSFIKRRLSMKRGAYLPFVNHVDYLILIALVSLVSGFPSFNALLIAYAVTLVVTPIVTLAGFQLGIRTQKL